MRSLTGLAIISEPSEVSDQSGAFPALSCESFHVLPVKIITKNKKKAHQGGSGAGVWPCWSNCRTFAHTFKVVDWFSVLILSAGHVDG